jgi:uncharacterized membrane protein YjjB (DUF3815 family)
VSARVVFFCNVVVSVVIARLCVSKKVVWSCCRLAGCMGYVIRGLLVWEFGSLMTMLFGGRFSWTGQWSEFWLRLAIV